MRSCAQRALCRARVYSRCLVTKCDFLFSTAPIRMQKEPHTKLLQFSKLLLPVLYCKTSSVKNTNTHLANFIHKYVYCNDQELIITGDHSYSVFIKPNYYQQCYNNNYSHFADKDSELQRDLSNKWKQQDSNSCFLAPKPKSLGPHTTPQHSTFKQRFNNCAYKQILDPRLKGFQYSIRMVSSLEALIGPSGEVFWAKGHPWH